MPIFRGSSDATLGSGQIVATQAEIVDALNAALAAQSAAETAETNAQVAQAAAEAALDNFDDRYLGAKTSDPTVDNDGDPLIDGALYYNTTDNVTKVYDLGTTTWLNLLLTASDQANVNTVAGIASDVTTVAGIDSDVTTVSGISSDVTTVSGISADVTTVATNDANVTIVATDLNGADTIGTVATNISNVNTVGNISADVTTVAGISSDVTTVALDAADIGTVASNIADVSTVAGISGDVTVVAGIDSDIPTVAGLSTEITALGARTVEIDALYAEINNIATKVSKTSDTGSAVLPAGTQAERDAAPAQGYLRFNTDTDEFEGYNGTAWSSVGGSDVLSSTSDLPAGNLTGDVAAARITDALNATGSAPIYACRAWVNFDGTGTVAIRESGNVSSITDNGTGDYTVNFTTAMEDANYSVNATVQRDFNSHAMIKKSSSYDSLTAASARIETCGTTSGTSTADSITVTVSIFR